MSASAQPRAADAGQAIARWKRGHQAFHLLLVAMTTAIGEAEAAVERRDWHALEARLGQVTMLYDAATASMRYAADFDPDHYEASVRPSMMPPLMRPGFSGALNREHAAMVAALTRLRLALKAADGDRSIAVPSSVRSGWSAVRRAQGRNRRHHALICSRFVPEGPSLLREFYRESATATQRSTEP